MRHFIFLGLIAPFLILMSCSTSSTHEYSKKSGTLEIKGYGPIIKKGDIRFIKLSLMIDNKGTAIGNISYSPDFDKFSELDSSINVTGFYNNKNLLIQVANVFIANFEDFSGKELSLNGEGILLNNKEKCKILLFNDFDIGRKKFHNLLDSLAKQEKEQFDSLHKTENKESELVQINNNIEKVSVDNKTADLEAENSKNKKSPKEEIKNNVKQSKQREDYRLDDSKLVEESLKNLSLKELRIMRNEIYARNGYIFASKDLREYFNKKDWYVPYSSDNKIIYKSLNETERYNVAFILKYENSLKSNNNNVPVSVE